MRADIARLTVESWTESLPEPATSERVRDDFWYIRLPGMARRWIPIEIELRERSVRLVSHVLIPPEDNAGEFYRFLLRNNEDASEATFAVDPEGVVLLVGRVGLERLDEAALDAVAGRIVEKTERTFRSLLRIGFATRLQS